MADELPNVQQAWAAVMREADGLGKHGTVSAGPARFNFRGIDAVMNYVGPVLRRQGVVVVPGIASIIADRDVTTSKGSAMRNVTVSLTYDVYGPRGDSFQGSALGEASDSGDKAVTKAMSVAYRTFLLQALCLPTDEPDPDLTIHDRAPEMSVNMQRIADAAQTAGISYDDVVALAGTKDLDGLSGPAVDQLINTIIEQKGKN